MDEKEEEKKAVEEKKGGEVKEAEAPAKKPKPKKRRAKKPGIVSKAKKKRAVARAVIRKGTGKVRVNNRSVEVFQPEYVYKLVTEPLRIAGDLAKEVDIDIVAKGGGFMGQAMGVRGAVAKALVAYSKDDKLRQRMLNYDRALLVDDARRTEPKKPLGPKARKKKQKSKR